MAIEELKGKLREEVQKCVVEFQEQPQESLIMGNLDIQATNRQRALACLAASFNAFGGQNPFLAEAFKFGESYGDINREFARKCLENPDKTKATRCLMAIPSRMSRKYYFQTLPPDMRRQDEATNEPLVPFFANELEILDHDVRGVDTALPEGYKLEVIKPGQTDERCFIAMDAIKEQAEESARDYFSQDDDVAKEFRAELLTAARKEATKEVNQAIEQAQQQAQQAAQNQPFPLFRYVYPEGVPDAVRARAIQEVTDQRYAQKVKGQIADLKEAQKEAQKEIKTKEEEDLFQKYWKENKEIAIQHEREIYEDDEKVSIGDGCVAGDRSSGVIRIIDEDTGELAGRVHFQLHESSKTITIGTSHTDPQFQGKGFFSIYRRELVNLADELGYKITTSASPFGNKPMPEWMLKHLYGSFGSETEIMGSGVTRYAEKGKPLTPELTASFSKFQEKKGIAK